MKWDSNSLRRWPIVITAVFVIGTVGILLSYQNCAKPTALPTGALQPNSSGPFVNPFTDGSKLVSLPLSIQPTPESIQLLGYDKVENDSILGSVFTATGEIQQHSIAFFPVDPNKTYTVSGRFKAVGTVPTTLYFGFSNWDINGNYIPDIESNRGGSFNTIKSVGNASILTNESITGWNGTGSHDYSRAIGFYYDGNTDKRPDFVKYAYASPTSTAPSDGAYQTATGTTIILNGPLPDNVVQNITLNTKITNHSGDGTYQYVAASNVQVPSDAWTTYSGTITGQGFNANATAFRYGTRYCKILLLLNYLSGANAKVQFTDLRVTEN